VTEPLKPTGFWSYTSADDTASRGRLSQLRRLLADALQLRIGRTPKVHIFQDVAAIPHGAYWLKEIHKALADSSFFIPIVTPAFLQSEMCCHEVLHFREREAAVGRDDLILPLHYISVDDVDPHRPSEVHVPAVLELLRSRQWIDFRTLRFRDPNGEEVALKLDELAGSIRAALRRGGATVTPAKDVPSPREPDPDRGERKPEPPSSPVVTSASALAPAGAPDTATIVGTGTTVPAAEASAGTPPAGQKPSPPPIAASATRRPAAAAPMRSWQRPAAWGIAGAVALLLAGMFAFLHGRGPPGQTAQLAVPQSAQPVNRDPGRPMATRAPVATVKPAPGNVTRDCSTYPELVLIPPGSFIMGVPPEEDDREAFPRSYDDEARPQHRVTIAHAFWLGRYPVTRGEYSAFVQDTSYQGGGTSWRDPGFPQTDSDPVVNVSATDAASYAEWLSRKADKSYRLPSEAEWEYAARAGTTTARFWGDDRDRTAACGYANVADETLRKKDQAQPDKDWYFACDDGYANTSPVGRFKPNGFGLYDMLGNVWQWTADCYNNGYSGAPSDGAAWTTGICSPRVLRSGSWGDGPWGVRAGYRFWGDILGVRSNSTGFRLARTL